MHTAEAGFKLIAVAIIANIYLVVQFCPGTGFPQPIENFMIVAQKCGDRVMLARDLSMATGFFGAVLVMWGIITGLAHSPTL